MLIPFKHKANTHEEQTLVCSSFFCCPLPNKNIEGKLFEEGLKRVVFCVIMFSIKQEGQKSRHCISYQKIEEPI